MKPTAKDRTRANVIAASYTPLSDDPIEIIAQALADERERAAKIVTGYEMQVGRPILDDIAAAVRAGDTA